MNIHTNADLNEVGVEEGAEGLLPHGHGAEDLRGGEGRVEEEADIGRARARSDQRRRHHQPWELTEN